VRLVIAAFLDHFNADDEGYVHPVTTGIAAVIPMVNVLVPEGKSLNDVTVYVTNAAAAVAIPVIVPVAVLKANPLPILGYIENEEGEFTHPLTTYVDTFPVTLMVV
jgi:hypothetical protein